MRGNPAVPVGPSTSKPTWSNTLGCSATSVFFVIGALAETLERPAGRTQIGQAFQPDVSLERLTYKSAWKA